MKNKKILGICITGLCILFISSLSAQTSSKIGSSSSRSQTSMSNWRQDQQNKEQQRQGVVRDFVMAVIGGMLRHPDPTIRKQAIQSISMGIISGEATGGSSTTEGGIRNLFAVNTQGTTGGTQEGELSTGVGGAVFIPDLYVLLQDPDPEVRDIASVGLDMIFMTDSTLLKFVQDPDPLVRKYATQIFARKRISVSETQSRGNEQDIAEVRDLLALRTMLVRLKYEKEPEVRKSIQDTLDWYIKYGGDTTNRGGREYDQNMFGVPSSIVLDYLNDPDPEIRKQAAKTIAARETSDDVLIKLLERLKVEKDEGVRQEIQTALDYIRTRQSYEREGRAGGGALPAAPGR